MRKLSIDENLTTPAEVRGFLDKAANDLGPHEYKAPIKGAIGVILDDIMPKFSENGGDGSCSVPGRSDWPS